MKASYIFSMFIEIDSVKINSRYIDCLAYQNINTQSHLESNLISNKYYAQHIKLVFIRQDAVMLKKVNIEIEIKKIELQKNVYQQQNLH